MNHGKMHHASATRSADALADVLLDREANLDSVGPSVQAHKPLAGVGVFRDGTSGTDRKPWAIDVFIAGERESRAFTRAIPNEFEGMRVRVSDLGGPIRYAFGPSRGRMYNPLRPGCSISRGDGHAGTLGCFVGDGADLYLVTAGHVLCGVHSPSNVDQSFRDQPIYQAATLYGGVESRVVARIADYRLPTVNDGYGAIVRSQLDVGIAKVVPSPEARWDLNSLGGIGCQKGGVSDPRFVGRSRVSKFGQHSGFTEGLVRNPTSSFRIELPNAGFTWMAAQIGLFRRSKYCQAGRFAHEGDSGSIVWDRSRRPIGMIIGCAPAGVIATPWSYIQDAFQMGMLSQRRT